MTPARNNFMKIIIRTRLTEKGIELAKMIIRSAGINIFTAPRPEYTTHRGKVVEILASDYDKGNWRVGMDQFHILGAKFIDISGLFEPEHYTIRSVGYDATLGEEFTVEFAGGFTKVGCKLFANRDITKLAEKIKKLGNPDPDEGWAERDPGYGPDQ